jgi:hypothetical protein
MHFLPNKSVLLLVCISIAGLASAQYYRDTNLDVKVHKAGNVLRAVLNSSYQWTWDERSPQFLDYGTFKYRKGPWSYYPRSQPWNMWTTSRLPTLTAICRQEDGTRDTLYVGIASQGYYPYDLSWDTVWVIKNHSTVDVPYWPAYQGISEEDFLCRLATNRSPIAIYGTIHGDRHVHFDPMYVDVIVQSFTWSFPPLEDIVAYVFKFVPTHYSLEQAFVGIEDGCDMRPDVPDIVILDTVARAQHYPEKHLVEYLPSQFRGWPRNYNHVGYQVFGQPSGTPLRWTIGDFRWLGTMVEAVPIADSLVPGFFYRQLSTGLVTAVPSPYNNTSTVTVGPYDVPLGDTLTLAVCEIYAQSTAEFLEKSRIAEKLFQQGFHAPMPPPPPHVRVTATDNSVTLHWEPRPGADNPETYTDANRGDSMAVPFEGYRLYKSTGSAEGPWTLIQEYDIAGNGFAHDFGIRYDYTDTPVLKGFYYYYTVTAFSKPDTAIHFPSTESAKGASVVRVAPSGSAATTVGEVAVVPNPYRGDIAYSQYAPSWEQPTGKWNYWAENDRRVTFIHLPELCQIKIFTLAGDLIRTLEHDDPVNSFENWNLTSTSYQAVSSGLYLFTVEDRNTGKVQTGKFVIIK